MLRTSGVAAQGGTAMRLLLRFVGLLFAAGTILFHRRRRRRGRPAVALFTRAAGLFPAAGLRARGDDPRACFRRLAARRICTRAAALHSNPGGAQARDQCFHRCRGQELLRAWRHRFLRHRARRPAYVQNYGSGRRPQGASTITQQVAKNFLLTNELSWSRKIKEALLSMKIERAFSKEKILELYLNEIYLGLGAYGVAAASLLYFDKSVHELTVSEAAYLAALPKAPNNYHPFRQRERAFERRNYVLDRMAEDRHITAQEAEKAKKDPLKITLRPTGAHIFAAEYFAEEVRRYINDNYTEKKLYEGGLSVRTTLDPEDAGAGAQGAGRRFRQLRRAAGLSRRFQQARHRGRLGHQACRGQGALRRRAVAARSRAGERRSIRPDRLPAGARTWRRASRRSARPAP